VSEAHVRHGARGLHGRQGRVRSMYGYYTTTPERETHCTDGMEQTPFGVTDEERGGCRFGTDGRPRHRVRVAAADVARGSAAASTTSRGTERDADICRTKSSRTNWELSPGDWESGADANTRRPSDFLTDPFIAFAKVDTANTGRSGHSLQTVSKDREIQFTHPAAARPASHRTSWCCRAELSCP
jgi:hypothetical protein